jgi:adenylate kinase
VILIAVPREEAIRRLAGRRVCEQCGTMFHVAFDAAARSGRCDRCGGALVQREDDREETIRKRLEVYEKQTRPLVDYYSKWAAQRDPRAPRYRKIQGKGSVEEIGARALAALK